MNERQRRTELITSIKERILELKSLYPGTPVKLTFNVPDGVSLPEKIKMEITEFR